MHHRVLSLVGGLCAALLFTAVALGALGQGALAQANEPKAADKPTAAGHEPAKEPQKVDEFAEANMRSPVPPAIRSASGSAAASSACCGATISTPPFATSISMTALVVQVPISRRRSAA